MKRSAQATWQGGLRDGQGHLTTASGVLTQAAYSFPTRFEDKPVKADCVAENERYITKVFEQLKRENPSGVRYAAFKLDDGVSFVHIASIEAADGSNPLRELSAFEEFTARIRDRCEEPPASVDLKEVGSYEFFVE